MVKGGEEKMRNAQEKLYTIEAKRAEREERTDKWE